MKRLQGTLVLPRRRAKRRQYNQAFKRHLVELTLVPGASVARIALGHRLNANICSDGAGTTDASFRGAAPKPAAGLLPATVSDAQQALQVISERAPQAPVLGILNAITPKFR